jgi:hypothetical protein
MLGRAADPRGECLPWSGVGHVAIGMHRQGYDLQLTRYDEKGWRATFLHDRDGALTNERDVACDAAGGGGSAEEGGGRCAWFY